jgi:hypothetical protein
MNSVYFKPCTLSQVSRRCSWRFHAKSASRFQCNRLDRPLKASGHLAVWRSFSVKEVWTLGQHRRDARSSFSNFYSELEFSRHLFGKFLQDIRTTWQPVWMISKNSRIFQVSFTKEKRSYSKDRLDAWPSRSDVVLFWEELCYCRKTIAEDCADEAIFRLDTPQPEYEFV